MAADEGFEIDGAVAFETGPQTLAGVGDVNGDGFADIAVGSPSANSAAVILGDASPTAVDVGSIPPGRGFTIQSAGSETGWSIAGGDVNGDGLSDVAVASHSGPYSKVLVVFGTSSPVDVDEAALTPADGFTIGGNSGLGVGAVAVGDLDRDGFADVAVAHNTPNAIGPSLVTIVRGGQANASVPYLPPPSGSRFATIDLGDQGGDVKRLTAADVNDDGYAELIIGGPFASSNGSQGGSAYVIRGGPTIPDLNVAALNSRWTRIDGDVSSAWAGAGLATGDVTGDGVTDLVVGGDGATTWAGDGGGRVAVFPGTDSGDHAAPTVSTPQADLVDHGTVHPNVPVKVSWSGADSGTGLARFDVQQQVDDGAWVAIKPVHLKTSVTESLATGHDYQYRVRSIDGSGNPSPWRYTRQFPLRSYSDASTRIRYHLTWNPSSSADWWGGTARYATAPGASASLTFTGREIVWVSGTGSNRGVARIYINGNLLRSVDLRLLTARATIVFRKSWSTTATRTIRIVVQATPGPNRVDFDGFAVMG